MGKRKMNRSETLNRRDGEEEEEGRGFFACYLLTSLCPRYKGHTYIGFTVNPRRRIRQHNGEIRCGAWRTKRKRPWEMVLCIYGFPTNVAALQFEWAWQHPVESLAVRKAAVEFKSLSGVANKVKLAYTMLTLPSWQSLNLTVNFFSTKYSKHSAGCPSLPTGMRVKVCSMDDLPCYSEDGQNMCGNDSWADDDEEEESTSGASEILGGGIEQATRHNESSTENHDSIKDDDDDAGSTQARYYPAAEKEDEEQPFCIGNPPQGESFCIENSPEREVMSLSKTNSPCGVICPRLDWAANESFTTMAGDKEEPLFKLSAFPSEVEVIDVFTPSPEYRIRSRRKKRGGAGASSGHPQIIDLTQSPIFV